jgi:hypothetical protein
MGVKFLNQNIVVNSTRPTGYKFPTGLSQILLSSNTVVDYLVVAGGAGGGIQHSGGGGAGGFRTGSGFSVAGSTPYSITVGSGGPGGTGGNGTGTRGANGPFVGASLDSRGVFESQVFRTTPFATAAARDTALPTDVVKAGMVCFVTDIAKLQVNTDGTTAGWSNIN